MKDDETILLVTGIIIVGNLIWRIVCEGMIIIFKIFEKLNFLENKHGIIRLVSTHFFLASFLCVIKLVK